MSRETQILALANAVAQALGSRAVYVPAPAQAISYSSAVSGLGANNVQDALDAVRTLAAVQSINGKTGTPVLRAADVGADPTGTAAAALTAHVTGPDPHPQYAPKINPVFTGMAQVQNFKATGTSYFNDNVSFNLGTGSKINFGRDPNGNTRIVALSQDSATTTNLIVNANGIVLNGNTVLHTGIFDPATKQNALGYTPVQQGTGVGQGGNAVKIGWATGGKLKVTIDSSDQGNVAMESWVGDNYLNFRTGGVLTGLLTLSGSGQDKIALRNSTNSGIGFSIALNSNGDLTLWNAHITAYQLILPVDGSAMLRGGWKVWDAQSFDPTTKASLSGATFTGSVSVPSDLTVRAGDSVNEGGQINLLGAGTNTSVYLDNYSSLFRVFGGSADPLTYDINLGRLTVSSLVVNSQTWATNLALASHQILLYEVDSSGTFGVRTGTTGSEKYFSFGSDGTFSATNGYVKTQKLVINGALGLDYLPSTGSRYLIRSDGVNSTFDAVVADNSAFDVMRLRGTDLRFNDQTVWRAGNFNPATKANLSGDNTYDGQARFVGSGEGKLYLRNSTATKGYYISAGPNNSLYFYDDGAPGVIYTYLNSTHSFSGNVVAGGVFYPSGAGAGYINALDRGNYPRIGAGGNYGFESVGNPAGPTDMQRASYLAAGAYGGGYSMKDNAGQGVYYGGMWMASNYMYLGVTSPGSKAAPSPVSINSAGALTASALTTTGNILGANLIAGGSGNGAYVQVGDNAKLIDVGVAHTLGIQSRTDANVGYIRFGGMSGYFGWDGSRLRTNGIFSVISPNGAYFEVTDGGSNYARFGWNADMSVNGSGWAKIHNDNSGSITVANANGASISGNGSGLQFNGLSYFYKRPNVMNATSTAWVSQARTFVQSNDPGSAAEDGDLWIW